MVVRDVSLDSDDTVYPALTALIARTLEETGLVEDMAQALGYNPALTLHLLNAAVGSTASSSSRRASDGRTSPTSPTGPSSRVRASFSVRVL